jgi:hypothetical protein
VTRRSVGNITINPNVRCNRLYPVEGTRKTVESLKTIGIRLNRDQAIHLARALLAASQEWDDIDITGYRLERRTSDRTYHVTITGHQEDAVKEDAKRFSESHPNLTLAGRASPLVTATETSSFGVVGKIVSVFLRSPLLEEGPVE